MNNSNLTLRRVLPEANNLNKQWLGVRVMWVLCCSSVGLTTWRHVAIDISTSGLGKMVWKSNNGTNFTILYPKRLHSLFPSLQAILFSRPPLHHKQTCTKLSPHEPHVWFLSSFSLMLRSMTSKPLTPANVLMWILFFFLCLFYFIWYGLIYCALKRRCLLKPLSVCNYYYFFIIDSFIQYK